MAYSKSIGLLKKGDIFYFAKSYYLVEKVDSDHIHCFDINHKCNTSFYNIGGICIFYFNINEAP